MKRKVLKIKLKANRKKRNTVQRKPHLKKKLVVKKKPLTGRSAKTAKLKQRRTKIIKVRKKRNAAREYNKAFDQAYNEGFNAAFAQGYLQEQQRQLAV